MKTENEPLISDEELKRMLKGSQKWATISMALAVFSLIVGVAGVSYKLGAAQKCKQEKILGTVLELNIDKDFWL